MRRNVKKVGQAVQAFGQRSGVYRGTISGSLRPVRGEKDGDSSKKGNTKIKLCLVEKHAERKWSAREGATEAGDQSPVLWWRPFLNFSEEKNTKSAHLTVVAFRIRRQKGEKQAGTTQQCAGSRKPKNSDRQYEN